MLSHRTFFLFLAIIAGVIGFVGAVGIIAFIGEFFAVAFLVIFLLMIFLGRKS
jgi:uncharacterized membrane protein YtjA (UPF0391 family)